MRNWDHGEWDEESLFIPDFCLGTVPFLSLRPGLGVCGWKRLIELGENPTSQKRTLDVCAEDDWTTRAVKQPSLYED